MFTYPDRIGQLAREHHHQMLAQASQRQLRHQRSHPAAGTRIIRRLAAVIRYARRRRYGLVMLLTGTPRCRAG